MWDLGRPEHAHFRAKNVRPDMLELRQEVLEILPNFILTKLLNYQVWVSDIAWLCPNTVGVCSKHGEIRRCKQPMIFFGKVGKLSKIDLFSCSGMMSEKGGLRGDLLLNLFGWRNLR